ncbi:MAG: hypothetical protein K6G88_00380 [Lachnospiraceae bacterium]|nr:hypothetical protein [Lachnospiraceae bacterium]
MSSNNDVRDIAIQIGSFGEKNRDASGGIRGFEFQNLIAIEELVKNDTNYVCCEYLEDVTTVKTDETCRIIQAKYYTTNFTKEMSKEVYLEVYSEYLKLKTTAFYQKKQIEPVLNVFVPKKFWIEDSNHKLCPPVFYPDETEVKSLVEAKAKNGKILKDLSELDLDKYRKEEGQAAVFATYSTNQLLKDYLSEFLIDCKNKEFVEYRELLGESLVNTLEDNYGKVLNGVGDCDKGRILLGLAYQMILETFDRFIILKKDGKEYKTTKFPSKKQVFDRKRITRDEFLKRLYKTVSVSDEQLVSRTIIAMVESVFLEILDYNEDMADTNQFLLEQIKINTIEWLRSMLATIDGQIRFYNTVTLENKDRVESYNDKSIENRRDAFLKSYNHVVSFIKYFWKIMYNLCLKKNDFDIDQDKDWLDPKRYVIEGEKRYICLRFEGDFSKRTVILPQYANDERKKQIINHYDRMHELRPKKWCWPNYSNNGEVGSGNRGMFDYQYSIAEIKKEKELISRIEDDEDTFYIECMKCIGIDIDEWTDAEDCKSCIFSEKCKEDRRP